MAQPPAYAGPGGTNFFSEERLLKAWLNRELPKAERVPTLKRLEAFGGLVGERLDGLIEGAHRDESLPRLERFDRWGGRIDEVRYGAGQLEARRLVLESGVLPPVPLIERMAKAYLLNQCGEGGVTCPLAMTDGLAALLESRGTPDQKKRYLPLLRDPAGPTPLTGGQFVTEKQGGSVVSENETRAARASDGSYRLTGLKWFCSNPGELWVTTAKPEGSDIVGLFLVPRRLPNGGLNECHILRLKDLCGTRGKATAEVEYRGAYAEPIGRLSHGLAILLQTVIRTSRIHVSAGSLGMMRRALVEARLYARSRLVMGRPAAELPEVAAALEGMEAVWTACVIAFFDQLQLIEKEDPAAEILIPLLKIGISKLATEQVRQAQLIFGGNGILRDFSILPRLSQDALIQEIWEGTHPVLAGHVLKAFRRPASRAAFDLLLETGESAAAKQARLKAPLAALRGLRRRLSSQGGLQLCETAFRAFLLASLLRESGGPLDQATPFSKLASVLADSR